MGYSRAGFEVVGVDLVSQPHYPFEFHQADVLEVLMDEHDRLRFPYRVEDFGAIHASPPCQAHSTIAKQQRTRREHVHPDHVAATREGLIASGACWVMENVPGAPMSNCVTLCGSSFGLDVRRHRLFEFGGFDPCMAPPCAHHWQTPRFRSLDKRRVGKASATVPVYGGGQLASVVGVHGHINYAGEMALREAAMGIDWMSPYELTQAIPPAYTEWIGTQLLAALRAAAWPTTGQPDRGNAL